MSCRPPAVAGQFYPAEGPACRAELAGYLVDAAGGNLADRPIAAIVPHAGWVCSGAVAGGTLACLLTGREVDTIIVFGTAHRRLRRAAAVDTCEAWETPLGMIGLDGTLTNAILKASPHIVAEPQAHEHEHSIEVQTPFLRMLCPRAKLLPIMVASTPEAVQVGRDVANQAQRLGREVAVIGSTDLTHYGPRYGFTPQGTGAAGLRWAKECNDRRMIDLCLSLAADRVVAESLEHHNACGGGAIAATLAAARVLGADRARLCSHTTSAEVLGKRCGPMDDAVGYAGILFLGPGQSTAPA